MKLRAHLQRNLLFFKLAQAVEKIGRSCFIKLTRDYVNFGAIHGVGDNDEGNSGGSVQCWSRVNKDKLFNELRIESNANNEIYLEIKVEDLLLAMRSSVNASAIVMRMTGKSLDPYLSFAITSEDHLGNSRTITQNVPIVKILTASGASNTTVFEEPNIPDPELHIMLPRLDRLRPIVASYKNLADHIVISANNSGEFVLATSDGVRHDLGQAELNLAAAAGAGGGAIPHLFAPAEKAQVETRFTGMINPLTAEQYVEGEEEPSLEVRRRNRPKEFVSVMVRVSDLQKVLQSHYLRPLHVVCSLIPNHSIIFYVHLNDQVGDPYLTYFIPHSGV